MKDFMKRGDPFHVDQPEGDCALRRRATSTRAGANCELLRINKSRCDYDNANQSMYIGF